MPLCPQCQKPLAELAPNCPSCKADLDLLVEYVDNLHTGLKRAEQLVRMGELDLAVWAYLEVLEVDPDNPEARRQVGRIATVVRTFDRTAPGRKWLGDVRGEEEEALARFAKVMRLALAGLLVVVAFFIGMGVGGGTREDSGGSGGAHQPPELHKPEKSRPLGK
jgi:hypothetical protein